MHREPVVDEKDIMRFLTTDLHTTPSATKPNPRLDDGRGFVHERGDAQTACPKQATGKTIAFEPDEALESRFESSRTNQDLVCVVLAAILHLAEHYVSFVDSLSKPDWNIPVRFAETINEGDIVFCKVQDSGEYYTHKVLIRPARLEAGLQGFVRLECNRLSSCLFRTRRLRISSLVDETPSVVQSGIWLSGAWSGV